MDNSVKQRRFQLRRKLKADTFDILRSEINKMKDYISACDSAGVTPDLRSFYPRLQNIIYAYDIDVSYFFGD